MSSKKKASKQQREAALAQAQAREAAEVQALQSEIKARLVFLVVAVCIAAIACFAYFSKAWFVNNKEVTGEGMTVQALVENTNLLISNVADGTYDVNYTWTTETDSDAPHTMKPASHGWIYTEEIAGTEYTDPSTTYTIHRDIQNDDDYNGETFLFYNTNPGVVGDASGYAVNGNPAIMAYKNVPVFTEGYRYYYDYVVYIASENHSMELVSLIPSIAFSDNVPETNKKDYMYAASVDFYIGNDEPGNYKGTYNLAGIQNDSPYADYPTDSNYINLLGTKTTTHVIDSEDDVEPIKVIMRFYIDGALPKKVVSGDTRVVYTDQAYVYSQGLKLNDFSIDVHFKAKVAEEN